MALFGLFNYNKEGPGISKNAPQKRTIVVFFETFFRNFWKFIPISFIYALINMPLITSGLANVGMTNVARNTARDKHSFGLSDFFDTVKKNWKQALITGIINNIVYGILLFDTYFFYKGEGKFTVIGLGIAFGMLFIFTVMNYYIWTLLITFNFSLKQIYLNSFKFVFINLKNNLICFFSQSLILGAFVGIAILLSNYLLMVITIGLFLSATIFPGFKFLLVQYCVFPSIRKHIIDPYYEEHPDEDLDKRRDLGLYTPEVSEEEDVFND